MCIPRKTRISTSITEDQKMKLVNPTNVTANTGIMMFQARDEERIPPVTAGKTEKCQASAAMTKLPITLRERLYFRTRGLKQDTQIITQKMLTARPVKPILYHLITLGIKKMRDSCVNAVSWKARRYSSASSRIVSGM